LRTSGPIVHPVTPEEQALADTVSTYWANFAKTGDPNGAGLPVWRPYDLKTRATLVITVDDKAVSVEDPMGPTRRAVVHYKTTVSQA
jgi:carboxylesterase type B